SSGITERWNEVRRCHPSGTRKALSSLTLLLVGGCGASPAPQSVHDASSLAGSPTVQEAENLAPQAAAAAAGLVAEAKALSRDGQNEEAGVVGEQALAAYQEAFALVSAAKAQARLEQAEADVARSEKRLEELSRAQARAQREAEA